jgi:hypothetical protein
MRSAKPLSRGLCVRGRGVRGRDRKSPSPLFDEFEHRIGLAGSHEGGRKRVNDRVNVRLRNRTGRHCGVFGEVREPELRKRFVREPNPHDEADCERARSLGPEAGNAIDDRHPHVGGSRFNSNRQLDQPLGPQGGLCLIGRRFTIGTTWIVE